jgi:hypothetical protein
LRALDRFLPPRFAFARPRDLLFRFPAIVPPVVPLHSFATACGCTPCRESAHTRGRINNTRRQGADVP